MSGLDFVKAARAHPDLKHIPVMVVTAYRSAADGVECLRAGAAAYIQKPLDFPAFLTQVKQILGHPL
jgi:CheY-like chemotaxis protein